MPSKKGEIFAAAPVADKPLTAIAGIGPANAQRIQNHGIHDARNFQKDFIGQKNTRAFEDHLHNDFGIPRNHAHMAADNAADHFKRR
uniref:Barrier-to-autointegration factor n=1 Tax=Rhabditophanes sp. KR3021 TaxID=114890 RepID=A0AC35UFM0_9BILA